MTIYSGVSLPKRCSPPIPVSHGKYTF